MKWSIKVGRLFGIDVYLHFTFLLLLVFLGFVYWRGTQDAAAAAANLGFLLALFGCVLLHEFGHALMARRFGIGTQDITLLPIGGLARLERMPENPLQELWVALAGPAVNVVIAILLYAWLSATGGFVAAGAMELEGGALLQRLMAVNVFLVLFNLLPAFPMDGGRVLRALLATKLGRRRATAIAANVGQAMAILFGLIGFFSPNAFLVFIAIFVYLGAQAEAGMVEMESALQGLRVRDAMMTRFRTLSAQDSLRRAVAELLAGAQQDFPVIDEGHPVGILRRNDLVRALTENRGELTVGQVMCRECETVDHFTPLQKAVEAMHKKQCGTVPVTQAGRVIGLLTLENVSEMVMINKALEFHPPGPVGEMLPPVVTGDRPQPQIPEQNPIPQNQART